jgi:hypothetical protein
LFFNWAAVPGGRFSNPPTSQSPTVTGNFAKMKQPTFPLIYIFENESLDLILSEESFSKVSTLALINTTNFEKVILFDKGYQKWTYKQIADSFKNNWWTKLLAKTFYNPTLNAKVIWTLIGEYNLGELKNIVQVCIEKDDDIITQYEEAEVISNSIDKAETFEDILKVLNKFVFEVDEKKLWKEQENRKQ